MSVLLFEEGSVVLPEYFQNVIDKLKLDTEIAPNEYLFLAVLYNILECGFKIYLEPFDKLNSSSFDVKALKTLFNLDLPNWYVKKMDKSVWSYTAKLRLGRNRSSEVTLFGQPSAQSLSEYLTVTMYCKRVKTVTSVALKTNEFVKAVGPTTPNAKVYKEVKKLSLIVKDTLVWPIKSILLVCLSPGCVPVLQRLPQHILDIILSHLPLTDKRSLNHALTFKYI